MKRGALVWLILGGCAADELVPYELEVTIDLASVQGVETSVDGIRNVESIAHRFPSFATARDLVVTITARKQQDSVSLEVRPGMCRELAAFNRQTIGPTMTLEQLTFSVAEDANGLRFFDGALYVCTDIDGLTVAAID
jgi:hypothetical protein